MIPCFQSAVDFDPFEKRPKHFGLVNLVLGNLEQVFVQDDQIRELTNFDRSGLFLLKIQRVTVDTFNLFDRSSLANALSACSPTAAS